MHVNDESPAPCRFPIAVTPSNRQFGGDVCAHNLTEIFHSRNTTSTLQPEWRRPQTTQLSNPERPHTVGGLFAVIVCAMVAHILLFIWDQSHEDFTPEIPQVPVNQSGLAHLKITSTVESRLTTHRGLLVFVIMLPCWASQRLARVNWQRVFPALGHVPTNSGLQ